jgi:hypothetical protein
MNPILGWLLVLAAGFVLAILAGIRVAHERAHPPASNLRNQRIVMAWILALIVTCLVLGAIKWFSASNAFDWLILAFVGALVAWGLFASASSEPHAGRLVGLVAKGARVLAFALLPLLVLTAQGSSRVELLLLAILGAVLAQGFSSSIGRKFGGVVNFDEGAAGYVRRGPEEGATDVELSQFIACYYREGAPSRAPRMLRHALCRNFGARGGSAEPVAYFFARIAQLNPGIVRGYEELWSGSTHTGRLLLLSILQLAGDDQTRRFLEAVAREGNSKSEQGAIRGALQPGTPMKVNVLDAPIRTGTDLDLLWVEFNVTGSKAPVVRIVDVLERADRLRQRLDEWLQSQAAGSPVERKRVEEHLVTSLGISFDPAGTQIVTEGDLDTFSMQTELHFSAEKFEAVKQALPFKLSNDDLLYMSVKAAAAWSLASNAQQHTLVLEVCKDEWRKRDGRAKLLLQEILARNR